MNAPRLTQALLRKPVDKTPVWIMRQAGRYLPEYRKVRERAGSFMNLCRNPQLACEVTLQPLKRFDLDAAIIFSDILTIPDAMGMELYFKPGEGPKFNKVLDKMSDIEALEVPNIAEQLAYVFEAIQLTRTKLDKNKPLIGFSGSPFTLACYMLEGGGSKQFHKVKRLMYDRPDVFHQLLAKLTQAVTDYLNSQIKAGADVIMLFDSWGGILTTETYQQFSLAYLEKVMRYLTTLRNQQPIPSIIFTKGGNLWLENIAQSGCDAIGIDWTIDIDKAKSRVGEQVAIQGNLDPAVLLARPEVIRAEVEKILHAYGNLPGHVFNLGHGITPDVPPENVKVLVDTVHEISASMYV